MLEELVSTLGAAFQPAPTPTPASGCPMALLGSYRGDAAGCGGFLLNKGSVSHFLIKRQGVAVGESDMGVPECHDRFL